MMIEINLEDLADETRCPVCLGDPMSPRDNDAMLMQCFLVVGALSLDEHHARAGVIKDARLIAQCMHRFCAVCIEKWLRLSKYATKLLSPLCHDVQLQYLASNTTCKPPPSMLH
jgi:Zinc finger, C3HC4 type (RING finger)